jgi:hypothetical protein
MKVKFKKNNRIRNFLANVIVNLTRLECTQHAIDFYYYYCILTDNRVEEIELEREEFLDLIIFTMLYKHINPKYVGTYKGIPILVKGEKINE